MYAIEVNDISKTYRLYKHPIDRLKEILMQRPYHQSFCSLSHISLKIPIGGIVGLLGENGAGKSTLLKILAGTLVPTTGSVRCSGRVAALLELGTSFHPEFTGRQNIYLNATLLGLSEEELRKKENSIIEFSELGEFIERPVKTYSSGMYMRLAFSIAASIDPDILIIDEALSVGDAHFQKKCIDRMISFKNSGKTIIFCSHSTYLIQELCDNAIWLDHGRIREQGEVNQVITAYHDWVRSRETETQMDELPSTCNLPVIIKQLYFTNKDGKELYSLQTGEDVYLNIKISVLGKRQKYIGCIGFAINRNDKLPVFGITTLQENLPIIEFYDDMEISIYFPNFPILAGCYQAIGALFDEHGLHVFHHRSTPEFTVTNNNINQGIVMLPHTWKFH